MGILESTKEELYKACRELISIQEILDIKPLDNEANWQKEFELILEVNSLYKNFIFILDKHKEILGEDEYKRLRMEAYNMVHTGREYAN